MKKIILFFFIVFSSNAFSCICDPILPISKELSQGYDVIFYGHVDSVSSCDQKGKATVYFAITELYKGEVAQHVKINFDCSSECMMSFANAEDWIIYAQYSKFDYLTVSICGHSRKKFTDDAQDLYLLDSKRTFDKELEFLKTTLSIQTIVEPTVVNNSVTDTGRHNEQPTGFGKLILLLVSIVAMAIVYFVTRKKK